MQAKTAIAKILKMEGVEFIAGFPMNSIFEAGAEEGIRPILCRNERVGVGMTDGFTRASFGQRIGVCAMQTGPGVENAFSGVAQAYSDSVPILILPSAPARRRITVAPTFNAPKNFAGITKWADTINFADRVPEMMRRAFANLRTGRPGPVLLDLPGDVANEELTDAQFQYKPVKAVKSAGDPADIAATAKALIAAKSPVIRAGQGVLFACAWDELRELAELLQIPVYTTMAGKSAFPENHPLALGAGGRTSPKMLMHFQKKADLVFAIGSSCTREGFTVGIPDGKTVIQSTIDDRDINKDYPLEGAIIGDAKLVLRQLIDEVKRQVGPGFKANSAVAAEIKAVKEEWLKEWQPKLTSNESPINPYRLVADLQKVLNPKETIITHDSGGPRDQLVPFWETVNPGGYIGWGKSTTLGGSLGFAMGAKLARPEKTCVSFLGNAAFGMVGMDFETAVRERIPILVVLMNNSLLGGYGRHHPLASKKYNLNVQSGDYAKVAEALGGYSEKVVKPEDIIPAVRRAQKALASGQAALLEVITREELTESTYQ